MQLPILSGVKVARSGFEASYPINMEHRVIESGLSKGQIRTARGIEQVALGPGVDRGGVAWKGQHYRVMGNQLVHVSRDHIFTELGAVGNDGLPCNFNYSFDRLAIRSAERLFYFDDALTEVTDPDLGNVLDVAWLDGYFVTTDGEFIVVTELLDPAQVDALKYGSAEADPDPLTGVMAYREELYAFGRNTIQVFRNVGGTGFPFANVRGAVIPFGCINANAKCRIGGTFAFIGGARDEPIGVFVASQGGAARVSDNEIDDMLAGDDPATIAMEARTFGDEQHLLIHLSDRSIALSVRASQESSAGAWHIAHSGRFEAYRGRWATYVHGRHYCGDTKTAALGVLTQDTGDHFGEPALWQFDAGLLFADGRGALVRSVEVFGNLSNEPNELFLSVTRDGTRWSNERARKLTGAANERAVWRTNTRHSRLAGFRVRGSQPITVARLDVDAEPLSV